MSFPENVANEALVRSERCCCICHKFCGVKIELHHIVQKADGGEDTLENCIPLCFDCHSDMGKADPKHPKGKHYSEKELRMHRDNWYKKVESGWRYTCFKLMIPTLNLSILNLKKSAESWSAQLIISYPVMLPMFTSKL